MKVNDILKENDEREPTELTNEQFDTIINSKFFKLNIEPNIDKSLSGERNIENLYKKILLHGTNEHIDSTKLNTKKIENRNKSRDTPDAIHHMANDMLEEKFGARLRDKLFTTNNETIAKTFGKNVSIVIPSDDYTLYTSETIRDFTFQVVNKLVGMDSDFKEMIIGNFLNTIENEPSTLAQEYKNLYDNEQKVFRASILPNYAGLLQTWIINKRDNFNDLYNILDYTTRNVIKDRLQDLIGKQFEYETKAYFRFMDNIDAIVDDLINFTNKVIKKHFTRELKNYVETIVSFERIPDSFTSNEIMVDASYATFMAEVMLEKILNYYIKQ